MLSSRISVIAPVFVALLVACGGSTESSGTSSGGSSSGGSSSGSPPDSLATVPVGIYHLDQVDATNLEIRGDGAFQWTIEGCDFGGGQCGSWTRGGGGLVLDGGPPGLKWTYDGSYGQKLSSLTLTKNGDDLLVSGVTAEGRAFTQTWIKGRSCAVCGGPVGPTGQKLCDEPLPQQCAADVSAHEIGGGG